ncbi:MAG: hypothetical protein HFE79_11545 [Ruminiclostridium sp.]|nr:hypothetical protein [Ruminiclostridium sp.]
MKPYKIITTLLTAALALIQCGCVDISDRQFIPDTSNESDDGETGGIGGDLLISSETTAEEAHTSAARPAVINKNSFSDAQEKFIESCFFMGDSICSGFSMYGLSDSCCAKAGVAARNINDFTFEYGGAQVEPLTAAVNSGKKNLVFLMGINDVNIESAEEFAEYYDSFLKRVEALCPDANLYVMSITPVTEDSSFCYNYEIDEFNEALYKMIENSDSGARRYIDSSEGLKTETGGLSEDFGMEDGVHLGKSAYYYMLYSLCEGAGVT